MDKEFITDKNDLRQEQRLDPQMEEVKEAIISLDKFVDRYPVIMWIRLPKMVSGIPWSKT